MEIWRKLHNAAGFKMLTAHKLLYILQKNMWGLVLCIGLYCTCVVINTRVINENVKSKL